MNLFLRRFAIEEIAYLRLGAVLGINPEGVMDAEHPGLKRAREALKPERKMLADGVSIIPIEGVLARKPDPWEMAFYGVEDSGAVLNLIEEARRDPDTVGCVLAIDSPGGMVTGGLEVSDAAEACNAEKPVVAWTGGVAASLGYHIGSAAERFIASRSAQVGSIGSIISYLDYTERLKSLGIHPVTFVSEGAHLKATGSPGVEMTKARSEYLQGRVNTAGAEFVSTVERRRGKLPDEAKTGAMFFAEQAQKMGLLDSVGDLSWAVANCRQLIRARSKG